MDKVRIPGGTMRGEVYTDKGEPRRGSTMRGGLLTQWKSRVGRTMRGGGIYGRKGNPGEGWRRHENAI